MPSRPLEISPAVSNLLRHRRKALGLTLRGVQELATASGHPIPYSTLAKVEQGLFDPGVKRLQQLLRLYHVPLQAVGDLLDLEDLADTAPEERDPKRLYALAQSAWKAGSVRAALAAFIALRMACEESDTVLRQKATVAFAVAASGLGKHRLALHLLDDLRTEPLATEFVVPVLLQSAIAWHWLGAHETALAFLDRASFRVGRGKPQARAWVLHERASVLADLGEFESAEEALAQAIASYRRAKDEFGYGTALAVGVRLRFLRSDPAGALEAAKAARFHALRNGLNRLATLRQVDQGHAELELGRPERAIALLEQALAESITRQDLGARFYAHFYLWKVAQNLRDEARAKLEFEAAAYHLGFIDGQTPEAREMRALVANVSRRPSSPRTRL